MSNGLVSVTQFATEAGVNRRTVLRWIASGRLPAGRTPSGYWRIERRHLTRTTLSTSEFARAVGVCQRTAYRWVKSGKVEAAVQGRDYRIPVAEVARIAGRKG